MNSWCSQQQDLNWPGWVSIWQFIKKVTWYIWHMDEHSWSSKSNLALVLADFHEIWAFRHTANTNRMQFFFKAVTGLSLFSTWNTFYVNFSAPFRPCREGGGNKDGNEAKLWPLAAQSNLTFNSDATTALWQYLSLFVSPFVNGWTKEGPHKVYLRPCTQQFNQSWREIIGIAKKHSIDFDVYVAFEFFAFFRTLTNMYSVLVDMRYVILIAYIVLTRIT